MSENSHYPPDYWKLEKENALLTRELGLEDQISALLRNRIDLQKERLSMWLRNTPPQEPPLQVTRKGSCKLIQFVPIKEN